MLGVEAHLDRVALGLARDRRERLAGRDPQLLLDEVDPGHELRHGMLDLEPRVQLQKPEALAVEHELGSARVLVADRAGERDRGLAHRGAQLGVDGGGGLSSSTFWWRRWIEHPGFEVDDRPVPVCENLDLDVAWALDVALGEDAPVAETGLRFARCRSQGVVELSAERTTRMPRPPPPAAALTISGKPSSPGSPDSTTGSGLPRSRFASSLSPAARIAAGEGPTKTIPAAPTASAKSLFSARKP